MKVELNKKNDNPFYGLQNCLALYQNGGKGVVTEMMLDFCWDEVKSNKQNREMFFVLLFSIGDITAREHNIFKGLVERVDSGGNSQREAFIVILNWLKNKNYPQFKKFLFSHLFNEYTSFDSLLANRIQTVKGKRSISKIYSSLSGSTEYLEDLADYCVNIIKGKNPSDKYYLAKFLTRPRTSKRKGHKRLLPETKSIMKAKKEFLIRLSKKMNFEVVYKENFELFEGYNAWRKEYIGDLESVLFSSKKILEFDKQEFLLWLEKLSASARYRVRRRLLTEKNELKGKWANLGEWFLAWESYKETKQKEQRVLEEKVRQQTVTQDEVAKLEKVKKEAKVTVGSVNFKDMFKSIVLGNIDTLKVQPFLDKVKLPYNTLVFIDDSGSMSSTYGREGFTAFDFANFIATICLMKNPDDIGRGLLGYYSRECRLVSTMDTKSDYVNSILRANPVKMPSQGLIKPEEHFLDNLKRMRSFSHSVRTGNLTNISAIPEYLGKAVADNPGLLEQLQNFPVWTIITDGNWNSLPSPEASLNDFFRKCQKYLGYMPYIIAIDVSMHSADSKRFSGIDNFMYLPPNPAQIEMLLTNFKDIDIMDVYTPLQSLYRSNRYDLVKVNTL